MVISTLAPPSTDLEISITDSLALMNVNVELVTTPATSVNFTVQFFAGTSPFAIVANAFRPKVEAFHASLVNIRVPEILWSGAPVNVTTPPEVVGSLKIGCDIETLAFCKIFHSSVPGVLPVNAPTYTRNSLELTSAPTSKLTILFKALNKYLKIKIEESMKVQNT